jgi:hypothetical protein
MAHVSFGQAAACPAPAALSRPPRRAPRRDLTITRAGAEQPHDCDAIATNSLPPSTIHRRDVFRLASAVAVTLTSASLARPPPGAARPEDIGAAYDGYAPTYDDLDGGEGNSLHDIFQRSRFELHSSTY